MKSPVISIDRGLRILDHGAREGCIHEARYGHMFRQSSEIELIDAGAEREYRPQLDEPLEPIIRERPDERDVDALWTGDLPADRKREVLEFGRKRCAPFIRRVNVAVKEDMGL